MEKIVIFIEDRLRRKLVRLRVDEDRRIDSLIQSYVIQFRLPRRYLGLIDIEYQLLRTVDNRVFSGPRTLREAGITEGDRLLLRSCKGASSNRRPRRPRPRLGRGFPLPELRRRGPIGWPQPRQSWRAAAGFGRRGG